jgi:hypothetical protein
MSSEFLGAKKQAVWLWERLRASVSAPMVAGASHTRSPVRLTFCESLA